VDVSADQAAAPHTGHGTTATYFIPNTRNSRSNLGRQPRYYASWTTTKNNNVIDYGLTARKRTRILMFNTYQHATPQRYEECCATHISGIHSESESNLHSFNASRWERASSQMQTVVNEYSNERDNYLSNNIKI
jgi:hypothetical protein